MKNAIFKLVVCCLLSCLLVVPSFAIKTVEDSTLNTGPLRFSNINVFTNYLEISDSGKASVTSHISARNADKVKVVAYLQQLKNDKWTTIKSWSVTKEGLSGGLGKTYYVMSGNSYRLKSYAYVYSDGSLVEKTSYVGDAVEY